MNSGTMLFLADNLDLQKKHIQIIKDVSMRLAGILNIDQISVLVPEVLVNTLGYKISAVQLIDEEKERIFVFRLLMRLRSFSGWSSAFLAFRRLMLKFR